MTPNPYGKYIEGKDVMRSLRETPARVAAIVEHWPVERFEKPWAPGKWNVRQILVHLAHVELVFSMRLRFTLASDAHVIQTFEQDDWISAEAGTAADALAAYLGLRAMNLALLRTLSEAQRSRTVTHPDFGTLDVDWLMEWVAGHELNHVPQLETATSSPS
jgi:hypothetical protein